MYFVPFLLYFKSENIKKMGNPMDMREIQMMQIKLALDIKEKESQYSSGELNLLPCLEKTDELYKLAFEQAEKSKAGASKVCQDSHLLKLQSKIVRQYARNTKVDSLRFEPRKFSEKVKKLLIPAAAADGAESRSESLLSLWSKLGEASKTCMKTAPTFNFLYGTFTAEQVETVKRKRKRVEKDKIGDVTKPKSVLAKEVSNSDVMARYLESVFSCFKHIVKKSPKNVISFYEFVTDPESFTRTVENIFILSLLVKDGHLEIFPDDKGLPFLREPNMDRKNHLKAVKPTQSILTIGFQEWQEIIKKFNFKKALIPARDTSVIAD